MRLFIYCSQKGFAQKISRLPVKSNHNKLKTNNAVYHKLHQSSFHLYQQVNHLKDIGSRVPENLKENKKQNYMLQ